MAKKIEITFSKNEKVLLADGSISNNDFDYVIYEDDELSSENSVVSIAHKDKLASVKGKKGVFLTVNDDIDTILSEGSLPFSELDIIVIYFANFNDGRGYSYASLLRRSGYTGELRAVGDVFKDTLFYMKRCGFASFELKAEKCYDEAKHGLNDFTKGYQAIQTTDNNFQTGQITV